MFYKTLLIIAISLTTNLYSQAQYQSIFGQNSTQWVFEWHNLGIDEQDTIYVEKDTLAFGHSWKKIMVTRYQQQFPGALLREDTTIGKVWYKALFGFDPSDTLVKVIFDFSLNINDTFDVSNMWTGGPNVTTTTQNTVDSIYFISSSKHIRFKGQYYPGVPPENYLFIEGIGGNLGLLWKQYSGVHQSQYLLCSYKDGIQTFYSNYRYNGNCNVFGASNLHDYQTLSKMISIFPNPAFRQLYFELADELSVEKVKVFDTQGRVLFAQNTNNTVDISNLSSGSYFIQFITTDHMKINKKFIKN